MYSDIYEAREYLEMRFTELPSDDVLEKCLMLASDKVELLDIRNRGELSAFPRIGETSIPGNLKIAVILEAYCMAQEIKKGRSLVDIHEEKVASISIDGITKTFVKSGYEVSKNPVENFISTQAREIMARFTRKTYEY